MTPTDNVRGGAERPIIFSAEMIRAILAGEKSQTRRTRGLDDVNTYPGRIDGDSPMGPLGYTGLCRSDIYIRDKKAYAKSPGLYHMFAGMQEPTFNPIPAKCPYGGKGDRLWVKEACRVVGWVPTRHHQIDAVFYRADRTGRTFFNDDKSSCKETPEPDPLDGEEFWTKGEWRSPIYMPRWACRLTLEIVSVRAHRLQSIDRIDARREGAEGPNYRASFCSRWRDINGGDSWHANPFVWALSFKRLEASNA